MFVGIVHQIKRGFWGPKYKLVMEESSYKPEPLLAKMSKYSDHNHRKWFYDYSEVMPAPWTDDGLISYDFDDTPAEMDADYIDARARRTYLAPEVDHDLPF